MESVQIFRKHVKRESPLKASPRKWSRIWVADKSTFHFCTWVYYKGESIGPFLRHGHADEVTVLPDRGEIELYDDLILPIQEEVSDIGLQWQLTDDEYLLRTLHTYGALWGVIAIIMEKPVAEVQGRFAYIMNSETHPLRVQFRAICRSLQEQATTWKAKGIVCSFSRKQIEGFRSTFWNSDRHFTP